MDYYIVFAGIVEVGFSTRLFTAINKAGTSGATKIIIFLSSLGGNILYWSVLSKDGRNLDPYFRATMPIKGFKKLNVFSMSNYLRSIKKKELTLDMPGAEKRIRHLRKYFPNIA